jgi:hypothetical protein
VSLLELRTRALALAERYVGVREHGGPNRGPQIERWLAKVGLDPGAPWCAAFLYGVYDESAAGLSMPNPIPRTGGVSKLWSRAPEYMRYGKPTRGAIFVHFSQGTYAPGAKGHCGLVLGVDGGNMLTVEGNTNAEGDREGDGVWYKTRPISYAFGFVDVGREGPAVG